MSVLTHSYRIGRKLCSLTHVDGSISYASPSTLPPETNYIQTVNYIMYFCWESKTLHLELETLEPERSILHISFSTILGGFFLTTCIYHLSILLYTQSNPWKERIHSSPLLILFVEDDVLSIKFSSPRRQWGWGWGWGCWDYYTGTMSCSQISLQLSLL